MTDIESTFCKPPEYYIRYNEIGDHLAPPTPMEGDFWSFGVVRNIDTPLPDYISSEWKYLYDERMYKENGLQKAVDIKDLLHRLLRVCIQFIKNIDRQDEEIIKMNLGEFQLVTSNMVRLLNTMRSYQLRENLIRGLHNQIEMKRGKIEEIALQITKAKSILSESIESIKSIPLDDVETATKQQVNESTIDNLILTIEDILL